MEKKKTVKKHVAKKRESISSIALAAIGAGKENDDVLKLVKRVHPDSKTTLTSISWYRSQFMKKRRKKNNGPKA